jgi:hypothetical protein
MIKLISGNEHVWELPQFVSVRDAREFRECRWRVLIQCEDTVEVIGLSECPLDIDSMLDSFHQGYPARVLQWFAESFTEYTAFYFDDLAVTWEIVRSVNSETMEETFERFEADKEHQRRLNELKGMKGGLYDQG